MFLVPLAPAPLRRSFALSRGWDRFLDTPAAAETTVIPSLDVTETDTAYTATMDLPGVSKDNVDIDIQGRRVTVQTRSAAPSEPKDAKDAKDGDRVLYTERRSANYARSFVLPAAVDASRADAKLEAGVLTLTLPKPAAQVPARITVR